MASFFLPYPTLLGTPHPLPSLPPSSSLSSSSSSRSSSLSSSSSSSSSPSWVRHHHGIRPHKLTWVRFRLGAYTSDDEWGEGREREEKEKEKQKEEAQGEGEEEGEGEGEGEGEEMIEMGKIKQALVDSFYGTERGLKASAETRAEIAELVAQIEAVNPTPAPTQALELLNGTWILVYTSFSELFPLLAVGTLPLVQVGEISQTVDSTSFTVENVVSLKGPLATRPLSAKASFEVQSPKRVQIKFEEGVIGTPQLIDSIEIPENLEFMGQKIDLQPIQGPLRSLQDATSSLLARTILRQPPLKFPIRNERAKSWLLTTYLDEDLRISRGDGGSVFVLIKQGSPLLTS